MKRLITVILGLGFLHRILFLGARQLWTDELMQARIIQFASPAEILRRLQGGMDLASPLDFLVQWGVTSLLGNSVWALRLHAVIFGTLSIWIVYRLAKFLLGDRVALYSAVLFAFYPLAYHYSLEARPYSLLLFLSLLSYDLLLRQVNRRDRSWRGWMVVAAVSTLLLYANFLGGLILIAQFASLVLLTMLKLPVETAQGVRETDKHGGPAHPVEWPQVVAHGITVLVALALFYPWSRLEWDRPLLSPPSEILNPKLLLSLIKGLGDNSYPVAALLLIGAGVGIRALWRHKRHASLAWLILWFLIPIPILLLIEIWAGYFFNIRHLLHITPPLLILAGYGIFHVGPGLTILAESPRRLSIPALAYAAVMICASVWLGQLRARYEPADWHGTAVFLDNTVRRGDALAMPGVHALLEYYCPRLELFHREDLDPGPGSLTAAGVQRRIVVCYELLPVDPCGAFPATALKDSAWTRQQFKGFSVFIRGK
jgi:uncharacterized membrane protein